ncbi:MerR family transcriptional regulator [Cellulomonas chitinilytica]|uniref:MerR family transcriptional regulator n=1 Tax=Cellulomonas chitinilytica TaxID=398759 RepID=A0A919P2H0_9CELL|nr:MerR family transcriptional regulator [Cellulomonas chitinilytica]GIG22092.1 MerR family transcriptional regulator [Cellulomonas chitinilytica]
MSYRIAEAAGLVGVAPTTLRYYEDIGLLEKPARGSNGYRAYDEDDVARLRFVTAVKNLGIPLSDVRELVAAYGVEDCSTVAHHVVETVAARLTETQERIGELVALAAQLQTVAARLADAPTGTACGDGCPCATVATAPLPDTRTLVPLTRRPGPDVGRPDGSAPADVPVACSLAPAAVPGRVTDWQGLIASAVRREAVDGGTALVFDAAPGLAADVARLAAAEQECCPFFDFTVRLTTGQVRLEVRAPADAADVVAAMFGAPA